MLDEIPEVQIVCNVDIDPDDLRVARLHASRLLGRWSTRAIEAEALLQQERYRRLYAFLQRHGSAVRVAPDAVCGFLHGKAGLITQADGRKLGFIGSMNETRCGWQRHYEILWEDESPEGIRWIEEEFDFLWRAAIPLPQAIIREVGRRSRRREVALGDIATDEGLAPAALVESPLYRDGFELQPWQRGFIAECLRHYRLYSRVRLLLADEVGLGKTLSLAAAAITICLVAERDRRPVRPIVIFAPASLTAQWQTELIDKLGVLAARWDTRQKVWLDGDGRPISPTGVDSISRCPTRIGIVSTGLLSRDSFEKRKLLELRFGVVILDETHKARQRIGLGAEVGRPNELLAFMRQIAARADHVLLGTATPVQTDIADLWALLSILQQGEGCFVLGSEFSPWQHPDRVIDILTGARRDIPLEEAWELLRSPLPRIDSTRDGGARRLFAAIRNDLRVTDEAWQVTRPLLDLQAETREFLEDELQRTIDGASFLQRENPVVRHVVLRKRRQLEDAGLLPRIGVNIHPDAGLCREQHAFHAMFAGRAVRSTPGFQSAYELALDFGRRIARETGNRLITYLLAQRLSSSVVAGVSTARQLLRGQPIAPEDDTEEDDQQEVHLDDNARKKLENLLQGMQHIMKREPDPKLHVVMHFLDREGWLQHGVIIFSQYYDTAARVSQQLAQRYDDEPIGLYAGADRSRLMRGMQSVQVRREALKDMVGDRRLRLIVATDAACEGLNLQTLGTLINIDLPWNPTRLEQRPGRIKRYGQRRDMVDMLNLVLSQTIDEQIYERLLKRTQDCYNLFGSLPDTIKGDWIDEIERLDQQLDQYIDAHRRATGFDIRYTATMTPQERDWRDCHEVLSRNDVYQLLSVGWRGS